MIKLRMTLILLALAMLSGCGVNDFYESHLTGIVQADQKMSVNTALKKARKLERKRDWKGADRVYRTAMSQHKSKKLKRRYRNFKARKDDYIARKEVNALIRKANALKRKHYKRKASDPGYRGQHWQEVVQVSKQLANKGLDAMKKQRYNLAERALRTSVRVHSNRTTRNAYHRYNAQKERREFAELVRKGRKMADVSSERR